MNWSQLAEVKCEYKAALLIRVCRPSHLHVQCLCSGICASHSEPAGWYLVTRWKIAAFHVHMQLGMNVLVWGGIRVEVANCDDVMYTRCATYFTTLILRWHIASTHVHTAVIT